MLLLGFDRSGRQAASAGHAVRTLASLVPATVEGVVRDLCLAAPGPDRALADVADHAGCAFAAAAGIAEGIRLGTRDLRCPHVLVIVAGAVVDRPFLEELTAMLPGLGDAPRTLVLKAMRHDLVGRLFPSAADAAAVLTSRSSLHSVQASTVDELARRLRPHRLFKTRAWLDA